MNIVKPPKDWTTNQNIGNQCYYIPQPGDYDSFMIDIRIWNNNVHIWVPMIEDWVPFTVREYKKIKVFLESL